MANVIAGMTNSLLDEELLAMALDKKLALSETMGDKPTQERINDLLLTAVHLGNVNAVRALLAQYSAEANAVAPHGETSLHLSRSAAITEILLSHGANPLSRDETNHTPLIYVANVAIAKHLLPVTRAHLKPNEIQELFYFVSYGNEDKALVLAYLVEQGFNIDSPHMPSGTTALMQHITNMKDLTDAKIKEKTLAAIRRLVAWGAKVETTNTLNETPLSMAKALPFKENHDAVLQALKTPLVKKKSPHDANILAHKESAPLIEANAVETDGNTPLHLACDDLATVKALIARGADLRVQNKKGNTVLHLTQSPEVAGLLLAKGANVNVKNHRQRTPLTKAIKHDNLAVAAVLLASNKVASLPASDAINDTKAKFLVNPSRELAALTDPAQKIRYTITRDIALMRGYAALRRAEDRPYLGWAAVFKPLNSQDNKVCLATLRAAMLQRALEKYQQDGTPIAFTSAGLVALYREAQQDLSNPPPKLSARLDKLNHDDEKLAAAFDSISHDGRFGKIVKEQEALYQQFSAQTPRPL